MKINEIQELYMDEITGPLSNLVSLTEFWKTANSLERKECLKSLVQRLDFKHNRTFITQLIGKYEFQYLPPLKSMAINLRSENLKFILSNKIYRNICLHSANYYRELIKNLISPQSNSKFRNSESWKNLELLLRYLPGNLERIKLHHTDIITALISPGRYELALLLLNGFEIVQTHEKVHNRLVKVINGMKDGQSPAAQEVVDKSRALLTV